jgi:hypothetical protein
MSTPKHCTWIKAPEHRHYTSADLVNFVGLIYEKKP